MAETEAKPVKIIGGGKLASHPEQFEKWLNGQRQGPLVVEVAATRGCNHDCRHCGFQQFSRFSSKKSFLDDKVFRRFVDDFAALGGVEIYFAGNGEPLLNPQIDEWIEYIHVKKIDCTLSTNGVLFDKERQARILPFIKWIRFSVNGGDAETYAKVHRCNKDDFGRLMVNLCEAVNYRDQHNLETRLVIQSLVYDLNWRSLKKLVSVHEKAGTDLLILRSAMFKDKPDAIPLPHVIEALKEVSSERNVQVRWETFGVNAPEMDWHKCYGINFRTNMDDLGNLFACLCPEAVYGNISEQSFQEIWNSMRKKEIFARIEKGDYIPQCKGWCPTSFDNVFIEQTLEGKDHGK